MNGDDQDGLPLDLGERTVPDPPTWPEWFHVGKNTPHSQSVRVQAGRHPFGGELNADESLRCGSCRSVTIGSDNPNRRYYKCERYPITRGSATDLALRWRACRLFQPVVLHDEVPS